MAEQKILDKKNWDACLYVPGIIPLYINFKSERKKYYFSLAIDETSQEVIALPTDQQFNDLRLLTLEFDNQEDPHVFTTDYGINLAFRNLNNTKLPSHTIHKQPFNEYMVQTYLISSNFQSNSVWKKLADAWREF